MFLFEIETKSKYNEKYEVKLKVLLYFGNVRYN